jgi:hypothetical protein
MQFVILKNYCGVFGSTINQKNIAKTDVNFLENQNILTEITNAPGKNINLIF